MHATTQSSSAFRSDQGASREHERGIALVVVLLLMAVLSGLATGFAMTGQVEVQMGTNEMYFAGARGAAEAGLNRAIVEIINDTTTNLLAGQDGAVSATPTDAVNADNGSLAFKPTLGAGPYTLGSQYSYTIEILDDDNPTLYETLSTTAITAMVTAIGENSLTYDDDNGKLILRATGFGPNGTTVRIARVIEVQTVNTPVANNPTLSNPALLVNGNLLVTGNISVIGDSGNIHANGNLQIDGSAAEVEGNAEATGTFSQNAQADIGGTATGGVAAINVPEVHASDYEYLATIKLAVLPSGVQQIQARDGAGDWVDCTTVATMVTACASSGWTYTAPSTTGALGTWKLTGNSTSEATYYAEGKIEISGSPKPSGSNPPLEVSIISTGSISISGKPVFQPANTDKVQFVTDGDLKIVGAAEFESEVVSVEGEMRVREQLEIAGNMDFRGRIIVQDVTSVDSLATENKVSGNPTIEYDGTLGAISTPVPPTMVTTYTNNISGWIEQ